MPTATLALAFVVCGYFAVSRFLITGSLIRRAEGHPQYFLSAAGGIVLFGLSVFVAAIFRASGAYNVDLNDAIRLFLPYFDKPVTDHARTVQNVKLVITAIVLCVAVPSFLNFPLRRNIRLAKYLLSRYGQVGPLEMVLDRCVRRSHPVMLTQASGKVYVGYVLSTAFEETNWLRILPVFSGYRDESHKFIITTDYLWIHELESEDSRYETEQCAFKEDFVVLVKLDTLTSVHPFDLQTHNLKSFGAYVENPLEDLGKAAGSEADDSMPIYGSTTSDVDNKVETKAEDTWLKNPGPVIVLPDWYHHPMAWDPPYRGDEQTQRRVEEFRRLYPNGIAYRFLSRRISTRFQRWLYFCFVFITLASPGLWALGDRSGFFWGLLCIVVCLAGCIAKDSRL